MITFVQDEWGITVISEVHRSLGRQKKNESVTMIHDRYGRTTQRTNGALDLKS